MAARSAFDSRRPQRHGGRLLLSPAWYMNERNVERGKKGVLIGEASSWIRARHPSRESCTFIKGALWACLRPNVNFEGRLSTMTVTEADATCLSRERSFEVPSSHWLWSHTTGRNITAFFESFSSPRSTHSSAFRRSSPDLKRSTSWGLTMRLKNRLTGESRYEKLNFPVL